MPSADKGQHAQSHALNPTCCVPQALQDELVKTLRARHRAACPRHAINVYMLCGCGGYDCDATGC
eukprot:7225623-Alexandrium_andersonii.AAC.1